MYIWSTCLRPYDSSVHTLSRRAFHCANGSELFAIDMDKVKTLGRQGLGELEEERLMDRICVVDKSYQSTLPSWRWLARNVSSVRLAHRPSASNQVLKGSPDRRSTDTKLRVKFPLRRQQTANLDPSGADVLPQLLSDLSVPSTATLNAPLHVRLLYHTR